MDYSRLSFSEIQKEAKNLGIRPLRGKGIDRDFLIKRIEEILGRKEKNLTLEEDDFISLPEETKMLLSEEREVSSLDEAIIREKNEDLYFFLLPVIDKIPSLRQEPTAPFEENPWSTILDELNAMNENEYNLLNALTNEDEVNVFGILAFNGEAVYAMFEKYPILLYGILLRRRREEDPWIQIAVVLSNAYQLYPFERFIEEPLYKKEEFHPFSTMFLFPSKDSFFIAQNYIRRLHTQGGAILIYLRIIATNLREEMIPLSYYDGIFGDYLDPHADYYGHYTTYHFPLFEEILEILFIIYDLYRIKDEKEAFIFANVVTNSILIRDRDDSTTIKFLQSDMFINMMKKIIKETENRTKYIATGVNVYLNPSTRLGYIMQKILLLEKEEIVLAASVVLKELAIPQNILSNIFKHIGRRISLALSQNEKMVIFARNILILSHKIQIPFYCMIYHVFEYMDDYKDYKPFKKPLYNFLSTLLQGLKKEDREQIVPTIKRNISSYLSERDVKRLEKIYE